MLFSPIFEHLPRSILMRHSSTRLVLLALALISVTLTALSTSAQAEDTVHIVQPGESLYRIGLQYGVSVAILAQANNISNTAQITAGQSLVIPDLSGAVENPLIAAEPVTHIVQPGETLQSIANRYGLTINQLAQINNIANPDRILRGQTLTVFTTPPAAAPAEAVEVAAAPAAPAAPVEYIPAVTHEVGYGDTLAAIASRYGVTVAQVMELNGLDNPNRIYRGQSLTIVAGSGQPPVESGGGAAPTGISYVVQPGDQLAAIAQRFGVSWPAVVQANNITDPNAIQAGQTLIIPSGGSLGDLGVINAPAEALVAAPQPAVTTGRSIMVDLSDSRIYAYEDGRLVRNALASMGRAATPTVQGSFTVQRKYEAQTMTGPGYYLPGVPWILYFYSGYAIHGTYWHNNFGQPMSHGCVNLPPEEAKWFYDFAALGTPVTVQY
jgi:LysM repeat protein